MIFFKQIRKSIIALIVSITMLVGVVAPTSVVYADVNDSQRMYFSFGELNNSIFKMYVNIGAISKIGSLTFDINYDETMLSLNNYKVMGSFGDKLSSVHDNGDKITVSVISDTGITCVESSILELSFNVNFEGSHEINFEGAVTECKDIFLNDINLSFDNSNKMIVLDNSLQNNYMFSVDYSETLKKDVPGNVDLVFTRNAGICSGSFELNIPVDKMRFDSVSSNESVEGINISCNDMGDGRIKVAFTIDKVFRDNDALLTFRLIPLVKNKVVEIKIKDFTLTNDKMEEITYEDLPGYLIAVGDGVSDNVFSLTSPSNISKYDEFTVDVNLLQNQGFGSLTAAVKYDSSVVDFVSGQANSDIMAGALSSIAKSSDGVIRLGVVSTSNITQSGKLATLVFRAKDRGTKTRLNLEIEEFTDSLAKDLVAISSGIQVNVVGECEHTWNDGEVLVSPNCIREGNIKYTCTKCEEYYEDILQKTDHDYSEEYTVDKESTCTQAGSESRHCKNCEATTDSRQTQLKSHDYSEEYTVDKESTCTQAGSESRHCKNCEATTDSRQTQLKSHDYSEEYTVDKESTCTQAGSESRHCKNCEATTDSRQTQLKSHDYSEEYTVDKESTCTQAGSESRHCKDCEATTDSRETQLKSHDYSEEYTVDKESTCTQAGSESRHCKNCEATTDSRQTQLKPHDYSEEYTVDKESTCTQAGSESRHCKNCEATTDSRQTQLKPHDYSEEYTVDKESTCTENGSKSIHCKNCDARADIRQIEATGHEFNNGVYTKKPTYTQKGIKKYSCKKCPYEYTKSVAVLSLPKPSAPQVTLDDRFIKVKWKKVAGATGYYVYRATGRGSLVRMAKITKNGVFEYRDSNVKSGTTYTYVVKAFNLAQASVNSEKVAKIYISKTSKVQTANIANGIEVKWAKVAGAKGYYIYRKTSSGSFVRLATIKSGATVKYIDKKVTNGTKYQYRVVAFSGKYVGVANNSKTAFRLSPVQAKKLSKGKNKVTVSISPNKKATGYQIQYGTSSKFTNYKTVNIKTYKQLSANITGLKKGKTYYVRVRAYKKTGSVTYYSAWSVGKKIKY